MTPSAIHEGSDFKGLSPGRIHRIICALNSSFLWMPTLPNQRFSKEPNSPISSEGRGSLLSVGQVLALREVDESPAALLNNV